MYSFCLGGILGVWLPWEQTKKSSLMFIKDDGRLMQPWYPTLVRAAPHGAGLKGCQHTPGAMTGAPVAA